MVFNINLFTFFDIYPAEWLYHSAIFLKELNFGQYQHMQFLWNSTLEAS